MAESIGDRLRAVRGGMSQDEFAVKLGVHKETIGKYERDKVVPGGDVLARLHEAFGVNINWLLTGKGSRAAEQPHHLLPVVGLVACGLKGWYEERKLGLMAEAPGGAPLHSIAVIACGESMIPAGINPGDTVYVDTGRDAESGQIALAELKDGGASIKRLAAIEGDWAVLEGWLPPEDGEQQPYVDRLRLSHIHRLMPVIAVHPGLPGLVQAAAQTGARAEAGPEIDKVLNLVPVAVAETMQFLARARLAPDPEPTADLCGVSMRLMVSPELQDAAMADRKAAIRRHLDAFLPMFKQPLWRRLIG